MANSVKRLRRPEMGQVVGGLTWAVLCVRQLSNVVDGALAVRPRRARGLGLLWRPLLQFAVNEGGTGPHKGHQLGCSDLVPAGLCGV